MRIYDLIFKLREYQSIHGPDAPVTCQGKHVTGLRLANSFISSQDLPIIVLQLEEPLPTLPILEQGHYTIDDKQYVVEKVAEEPKQLPEE